MHSYVQAIHAGEDWGLEDPAGKSIEEFRKVRDTIKLKVEELVFLIKDNNL